MDFASDYVLEGEESEEEIEEPLQNKRGGGGAFGFEAELEVESDDEDVTFECEIMDFDDEEETFPVNKKKSKKKGSSLNTVKLPLTKLKDEKPDLILKERQRYACFNSSCGAVLSHIDKPVEEENEKIWRCRFCGVERSIAEWPEFEAQGDVLYTADPSSPPDLNLDPGDGTVIFVVDTSGSMAQTVEPNSARNRAMQQQQYMMSMFGSMGHSMMNQMGQFFGAPPLGPQKAISSSFGDKTRLEAVKEGLMEEIRKLKETSPKTKVGLIHFNEEVYVLGDGTSEMQTVGGEKLMQWGELMVAGQQQPRLKTVSHTAENLVKALDRLHDQGRTALGPALTVAMTMAAKNSKTSKIVLCTDGYANIGLGRIHEGVTVATEKFYKDVAQYCKSEGISVSLIAFDEVGFAKALGSLPVETGGQLCGINPNDTSLKINDVLTQKIMATDAFVKFVVNKQLFVQDSDNADQENSQHKHMIGNLHSAMQQAFSFGFKQDGDDAKKPPSKPADPNEWPDDCMPHFPQPGDDDYIAPVPSGDANGKLAAMGVKVQTIPPKPEDKDKPNATLALPPPDVPKEEADSKVSKPECDIIDMKEGVVNADQAFEKKEEEKKEAEENEVLSEIPFQVQIFYVDLNGVEATRVWTNLKPITTNKEKAEEASNVSVRIGNLIQTNSTRLLDIFNNKIKDSNLSSEARKLKQEVNKLLDLPNLDTNLMKELNEFQNLVQQIQSQNSISEKVAEKLRNYQALGVNLKIPQDQIPQNGTDVVDNSGSSAGGSQGGALGANFNPIIAGTA